MKSRRWISLGLTLLLAAALPAVAFAKDLERTRVALVNSGAEPAASGKAEFRQRKVDRARFKVEAEDLTPANYDLTVGGVVRGVLDVQVLPDGSVEGELEFDTKVEPGHLPLDFDPHGQLVTVERAGVVYLQVVFPNAPVPAPAPTPATTTKSGGKGRR